MMITPNNNTSPQTNPQIQTQPDTVTVPLAPWTDPEAGTITVSAEDADLVAGVKWYAIKGPGNVHRIEVHPDTGKRYARYLSRDVLARKLGRPLVPGEKALLLDGVQSNLTRGNVVSSTTHHHRWVAMPIQEVS